MGIRIVLDSKTILVLAGILGALAVTFGAFGAHALKGMLSQEMLDVFDTGVRYQAWHATALLFLGLVSCFSADPTWRVSATLMLAGSVLFSFSLYGLALGGPRWLGPVTPLGGVLMIAAWATLVVAAWKFEIK